MQPEIHRSGWLCSTVFRLSAGGSAIELRSGKESLAPDLAPAPVSKEQEQDQESESARRPGAAPGRKRFGISTAQLVRGELIRRERTANTLRSGPVRFSRRRRRLALHSLILSRIWRSTTGGKPAARQRLRVRNGRKGDGVLSCWINKERTPLSLLRDSRGFSRRTFRCFAGTSPEKPFVL